eukprot:5566121-Amphidinium_carterae.1
MQDAARYLIRFARLLRRCSHVTHQSYHMCFTPNLPHVLHSQPLAACTSFDAALNGVGVLFPNRQAAANCEGCEVQCAVADDGLLGKLASTLVAGYVYNDSTSSNSERCIFTPFSRVWPRCS